MLEVAQEDQQQEDHRVLVGEAARIASPLERIDVGDGHGGSPCVSGNEEGGPVKGAAPFLGSAVSF